MKTKKIPNQCPACDSRLAISQLSCTVCDTRLSGHFPLPALLRLNSDDQSFIIAFVLASGSLKAMASQLGVSYPTVRNRLDDIIQALQAMTTEDADSPDKAPEPSPQDQPSKDQPA